MSQHRPQFSFRRRCGFSRRRGAVDRRVLGQDDDFDRAVALVPCEIDDQLRTRSRWD